MADHKRLAGWLAQLFVAISYASGYLVLHQISFANWTMFAGLRLAVLLLTPYRFWGALIAGELGATGLVVAVWGQDLGPWFALAMLVPPIGLAMPWVKWCLARGRVFGPRGETNINVLLLCATVSSIIWTVTSAGALLALPEAARAGAPEASMMIGQYFLGNYLGILTLVPLVLIAREELLSHKLAIVFERLFESRFALECISMLLPSLALLVWVASRGNGDGSEVARVAMFLPVAWLSLRHGWRGAAVGGAAASIAVVLAMPQRHDQGTLQAQVFIAFTITTMLLLGGRIGVLDKKDAREREEAKLILALAQRNVYLGELQLRRASFALEQIGNAVQTTYDQLLGKLRHLLPATDERNYFKQAALTQHQVYRLVDSLYPVSWRERGLPAALREGAIPRALDEVGIGYWCDLGGRGLSQLSVSLHIALYRLACDAVSLACAGRNVSKVRLRLRGGTLGSRRWAFLCVESLLDTDATVAVDWEQLSSVLGTSGLGLRAIEDRAAVFEGKVRMRKDPSRNRVSILLFDPDVVSA